MTDDVDLPPLVPSRSSDGTRPQPPFLLTRKRTHTDLESDITTSSDPALFSSDEAAPDLENYSQQKRKKHKYRGPWWEHHRASHGHLHHDGAGSQGKKRAFTRNFDSGIFMGSEGSDELSSSDSLALDDEFLRDQRRAAPTTPSTGPADPDATPRAKVPVRLGVAVPKEHQEVCRIVQQCLDEGKENVDLTSMGLSSLPNEISHLQTLSKQADIVPGMLDIGANFESHLRLFLSNNHFTAIPSPVLDLTNLRELSVRNNDLSGIPSSIRELTNLETLNVAGNLLTELPFELVELTRLHSLRTILASPNPLTPPPIDNLKYNIRSVDVWKTDSFWLGRLEIPPSMNPTLRTSRDAAPTLSEVVLRQLAQIDPAASIDYSTYLDRDAPAAVLAKLALLKTAQGRRCTTCDRPVVTPGREWVEWWRLARRDADASSGRRRVRGYYTAVEGYMPFRRVQCSSRCRGTKNGFVEMCAEYEVQESNP